MYNIAKVAVENAGLAYDALYSYFLPAQFTVLPGQRVQVPFGKGNRKRTGIVVETHDVPDRDGLKPILQVLDTAPLLEAEGLYLLRYLKECTFCTWFDALRLLIPAGLSITSHLCYSLCSPQPVLETPLTPQEQTVCIYLTGKRKPVEAAKLCKAVELPFPTPILAAMVEKGVLLAKEEYAQAVQDEKITMVRRCEDFQEVPLSPKQRMVLEFLTENEAASVKEVCYYTATTRAVVDALVKKGGAEYFDTVHLRDPYECSVEQLAPPPALSQPQEAARAELSALLGQHNPQPALLYGVTGAGKTQVFLSLMEQVLQQDKTVIVLVPEISLTAQTVREFHARFGKQVAVLHSALSLGERMDQWRRLKSGDATIAVGTRSAVFAPLANIGLIVLDEEQEHTYKSEKSPRFHARDIARLRCRHHGALLLLSSATPSVESYYHAKQGNYHLVELTQRFNQAPLPDVYTVDMRESSNLSAYPSLSGVLLEELRYNLDHGEQSILLLNRRGYSTIVKCSGCSTVADCPHCSVALTYHSANDRILCHYCGYLEEKPQSCSHCGSSLIRYAGAGTQKVAEELSSIFPEARILRIDTDTTMKKFSHENLFGAFANREYDIMIGTQMVAKGLNFPGVTLVGVLSADQSLYSGDFRSFERSFSLLTQVVGRSGRGQQRGRALVQTYSPENPIIQLAAMQDYPRFYSEEILSRRLHLYPPYCTMVGIGFVGEHQTAVCQGARQFLQQFTTLAAQQYPKLPVRLMGPIPADIAKAAGKYRYKLLLKCKNTKETRALLGQVLSWFLRENKQVHAFVDMYYDRL